MTRLRRDLQIKQDETEMKDHQVQQLQRQSEEKSKELAPLQRELDQMHQELETNKKIEETHNRKLEELNAEVKASKSAMNWFKTECEKQQNERQRIGENLEKRDREIQEAKQQLDQRELLLAEKTKIADTLKTSVEQLRQELIKKDNEFHKFEQELENKTKMINEFTIEKDRLDSYLENVNNSLPSSVIIVDKDAKILHWNKKAEELLTIRAETVRGKKLFDVEVLGKERVREGLQRCQQEKKPVLVSSISVKNTQGDISLTDISALPLIDRTGEFQGAVLVMNDVSAIAGLQAELQQKKDELDTITSRYQGMQTRLKFSDMEKQALNAEVLTVKQDLDQRMEQVFMREKMIEEKQRELTSLGEALVTKMNELNNVTIKVDEGKSLLNALTVEIERKHKELSSVSDSMSGQKETWKEKLIIYDEIDKCLNITDDTLKTKKLKDAESDHTA
jgi:PAS domain S-box-containing protein